MPRTRSAENSDSENITMSQKTLASFGKKMRANKKKMARSTEEQRPRLKELRNRKEVAQLLMPDAPAAKKPRKVSPVRVSCPLLPGTPEVPPPCTLQHWELERRASVPDAGMPCTVDVDETVSAGVITPPPIRREHVFTSSTGKLRTYAVDQAILVPEIELIEFSPSASSSAGHSALQNMSPVSTSTRPDPSVYKDNMERDILEWECSMNLHSDSDGEEEDCFVNIGATRIRTDDTDTELPLHLSEALANIDRQDDCALREIANVDMLDFDWSHDREVFKGEREIFTGQAGTTFSAAGMTPFEIFSKIWDPEIILMIVIETNRYGARLCSDENLPGHSRLRQWTPITPEELWTFFGVLMLQSIVPLPVEVEYWRPCLPYLKFVNFADIMPFNRFILIKKCLHFVDNDLTARGITTRLTKIKPIVDHLNKKFSSLYLPEQEIAIDESLLLWKGRLSFAQRIASKAAQVGIKSYELCESRTGYLWQMLIYTGKDGHSVDPDVQDEAEPEGAMCKIVYHLVRPLLNKGHTLVMDNFCNSPLLSRTLKCQKTDVMGTLRLNREFVPESLRHKNKTNMRAGEVAFSQTKDITIAVWRDANVISMISTYHKIEVDGAEKYGYHKHKPKVALDYNLSMGGIDKKDQVLQAFPIERVRNLIWYKKLFRRLLNVSIHNAFVMFSSVAMPKVAQRQFRLRLADEILQRFRPPKIHAPPATGHFPAKNTSKRARCKWCALKKIDACTVWKCDTCNVNLCILGCFKDYHINKTY